jgi:anti-sigma factor ChrR (cupin superfamily)
MADPDIAHADIAGWVLGALDPDESERFQAHLETCDECQREVAELSPSSSQIFILIRPATPGARDGVFRTPDTREGEGPRRWPAVPAPSPHR